MSISARELTTIGIRLIAILIAAYGLAAVPYPSYAAGYAWEPTLAIIMSVAIAWPLLLGLVLWAVAHPLAEIMVGVKAPTENYAPITLEQLQVVDMSIAGLLLVFVTVPSLLGQLLGLYESSEIVSDLGIDRRVFKTSFLVATVTLVLKLVLGLLLMTTPRFWVTLLHRLREVGLPREPPPDKGGGRP